MKQLRFEKLTSKHRHTHGGILRNQRLGRSARALSTRQPLHLVFKANKDSIRGGLRTYRRYFLIQKLIGKYSRHFFIKIEKYSIQNDPIHLLIRTTRRSQFQNFFRVLAGQIAQRFILEGLMTVATDTPLHQGNGWMTDTLSEGMGTRGTDTPKRTKIRLWKFRPFSRVVYGLRGFRTCLRYIQLNEYEALGIISYQKDRLRGVSSSEWEILWGSG